MILIPQERGRVTSPFSSQWKTFHQSFSLLLWIHGQNETRETMEEYKQTQVTFFLVFFLFRLMKNYRNVCICFIYLFAYAFYYPKVCVCMYGWMIWHTRTLSHVRMFTRLCYATSESEHYLHVCMRSVCIHYHPFVPYTCLLMIRVSKPHIDGTTLLTWLRILSSPLNDKNSKT